MSRQVTSLNLDFVGGNLGFELAKRGHDVWLLDQRSTFFSANHTFYHSNQAEYWDWCLDQMALIDLPVTIDYITTVTGSSRIGYVGYSQGSMTMFMLMSRIPKYNQIIRPFVSLAPIFFLSDTIHTRAPQIRNFPYRELESILKNTSAPLVDDQLTLFLRSFCRFQFTQVISCQPIFYTLMTFLSPLIIPTLPNVNYNRIPVYVSASLYFTVSTRQIAQYIQNFFNNLPQQLDLSPEQNLPVIP